MKLIYWLPIVLPIVLQPTIASAPSPTQIQSIAQSVTLKIEASGGGVFDIQGQLIAIHGNGDRYPKGAETSIDFDRMSAEFNTGFGKVGDSLVGQKLGINRGIPINYLRQGLANLNGSAQKISNNKPFQPSSADDWFILGINKTLYEDTIYTNSQDSARRSRS
jgi:hypothetical protein